MSQKQVGLNNFSYLKVIPIRVRKKGTKKQLLYNVMSSRVELSTNCRENTEAQAIHVITLKYVTSEFTFCRHNMTITTNNVHSFTQSFTNTQAINSLALLVFGSSAVFSFYLHPVFTLFSKEVITSITPLPLLMVCIIFAGTRKNVTLLTLFNLLAEDDGEGNRRMQYKLNGPYTYLSPKYNSQHFIHWIISILFFFLNFNHLIHIYDSQSVTSQ